MSRHDSELTDAQWDNIAPLVPEPQPSPRGAPSPRPIARVSKGSCGCCAAGHGGRMYPRGIPPPGPAGDAGGTGKRKTSG
jgi:transposase